MDGWPLAREPICFRDESRAFLVTRRCRGQVVLWWRFLKFWSGGYLYESWRPEDGGSSEWCLRKQGSFLVIIYVSLFIYFISISGVLVSLANDYFYARVFLSEPCDLIYSPRIFMQSRNSRVPKNWDRWYLSDFMWPAGSRWRWSVPYLSFLLPSPFEPGPRSAHLKSPSELSRTSTMVDA